ncbi:hypothetical protein HQ585_01915 [candidate division KSB1 bacterium]|nr:hypothetical protein [candidate division KSB1 bacterium]
MKNIILSLLFLSVFSIQIHASVRTNSYNILLEIFPENQSINVQANIKISIDPENIDSLVFYLHKEFSIKEIKSDDNISYDFKTEESSPYFWMPDARPLWIKLENNKEKDINVQIVYQGSIKDLKWKTTNMITESWIELGNYSAWFPYNPDYGEFISSVNLEIDSSYLVTGMGQIQKSGNAWKIEQLKPASDIVIIASKDLKTFYNEDHSKSIRLDYVIFNEQNANETIQDAKFIVELYKNWFKPSPEVQFTIVVVPPFPNRGSYHRKNFVALLQPEPGVNISFHLIAHEIAHEWWNSAPTDNFEDWLNESFAEYSSLMAIRDQFGIDRFEEWIQYKEFSSRESPPILQPNTNTRGQTSTLYDKGPLILYNLEKRIGRIKFLEFLRELLNQNIKSTDDLLNLLEGITSKEIRAYFENELLK